MKFTALLPLAAIVTLAGCIDGYEQCVRNNSKDLNVIYQLIEQSEATLNRGYGFETRIATQLDEVVCVTDEGAKATCLVEVGTSYQAPVAVDLDAERRKLEQLHEQRRVLQARVEDAKEVCRARYPAEG